METAQRIISANVLKPRLALMFLVATMCAIVMQKLQLGLGMRLLLLRRNTSQ
jgi:hypothetical protein